MHANGIHALVFCHPHWLVQKIGLCDIDRVEDQKKLDVLANEVFINVLRRCGQCSVLVRPFPLHIYV